jgi:hypothetical protein
VFMSERGAPVSPVAFRRILERFGKAAKMAFGVHPHMLRHKSRRGPQPLRASRLLTVIACHLPPRAVATPRAFNDSAMARNEVAPARCISRMIGRTLAAWPSAPAQASALRARPCEGEPAAAGLDSCSIVHFGNR